MRFRRLFLAHLQRWAPGPDRYLPEDAASLQAEAEMLWAW
jgi:hypothetical protein